MIRRPAGRLFAPHQPTNEAALNSSAKMIDSPGRIMSGPTITNGSPRPPALSLKRHPPRFTGCASKLVNSHQSAVGTPGLAAGLDITSVIRRSGFTRTVSVAELVALPLAFDATTSYWPAALDTTFDNDSTELVCPASNWPFIRHVYVGSG